MSSTHPLQGQAPSQTLQIHQRLVLRSLLAVLSEAKTGIHPRCAQDKFFLMISHEGCRLAQASTEVKRVIAVAVQHSTAHKQPRVEGVTCKISPLKKVYAVRFGGLCVLMMPYMIGNCRYNPCLAALSLSIASM